MCKRHILIHAYSSVVWKYAYGVYVSMQITVFSIWKYAYGMYVSMQITVFSIWKYAYGVYVSMQITVFSIWKYAYGVYVSMQITVFSIWKCASGVQELCCPLNPIEPTSRMLISPTFKFKCVSLLSIYSTSTIR